MPLAWSDREELSGLVVHIDPKVRTASGIVGVLGPIPRVYSRRRTRKIRPPADDSRPSGAEHEGPDERNLDALQL